MQWMMQWVLWDLWDASVYSYLCVCNTVYVCLGLCVYVPVLVFVQHVFVGPYICPEFQIRVTVISTGLLW